MPANHPWTRRHIRRSMVLVGLCVISALAPIALLLILKPTSPPLHWRKLIGYTALSGMVGFGGAAALGQLVWYVPVRRRVIAARGMLCGQCLFPLDGLGIVGACPECGLGFNRDENVVRWREDLDLNQFDQAS